MGRDVGGDGQLPSATGPAEGGPQVGQLCLDPVHLRPPTGPVPSFPAGHGLAREVSGMPVVERHPLGLVELVVGERADRLEEAVARPFGAVMRDDERLAHQGVDQPQHGDLVGRPGERAQGRQVEPPGEGRGGPHQRPLVVGQQVERPGHGVLQGQLSDRSVLRAGEQPEPVTETVPDLGRAHRCHPGGGQLDAEGQAVDRLADLDDRLRGPLVVDPEARAHGGGALHEQGHRSGGHPAVEAQGRHRHELLAGDLQAFARRGDDPRDLGASEDLRDRRRSGGQDVLAVVDHQEQASAGDGLRHGLDHGGRALRRDAEGLRERVRHGVRGAEGSQLHQPHPVRVGAGQLGCRGQGQSGLADTADPAQRHQLPGADERGDRRELVVAADEGRGRPRQVAAPGLPVHAGQSGTDPRRP